MRLSFRQKLEAAGPREGVTWNHVTDQIGMFCYTGLSLEQVDDCFYHIFIFSVGLRSKNAFAHVGNLLSISVILFVVIFVIIVYWCFFVCIFF